MSYNIPKKVIDVTGVELTPESLWFVLATESKAVSAVAMSASTFCFVSRNSIPQSKKI